MNARQRILASLAAPLTGLFLIFAVVAFVFLAIPQGIIVEIAARSDCDFGVLNSSVVLSIRSDGRLAINEDRIQANKLDSLLEQIYSTRNERIIFLKADREVPFQAVVKLIGVAQRRVDYVALITPSVEQERDCYVTIRRLPPIPPVKQVDLPPWMRRFPLFPW